MSLLTQLTIVWLTKRGSGGEKLGNQTWSVNLLSHSDNEFHYNWFILLMICCVFHEESPRPMKIENDDDLMIEFTILLSNFSTPYNPSKYIALSKFYGSQLRLRIIGKHGCIQYWPYFGSVYWLPCLFSVRMFNVLETKFKFCLESRRYA